MKFSFSVSDTVIRNLKRTTLVFVFTSSSSFCTSCCSVPSFIILKWLALVTIAHNGFKNHVLLFYRSRPLFHAFTWKLLGKFHFVSNFIFLWFLFIKFFQFLYFSFSPLSFVHSILIKGSSVIPFILSLVRASFSRWNCVSFIVQVQTFKQICFFIFFFLFFLLFRIT